MVGRAIQLIYLVYQCRRLCPTRRFIFSARVLIPNLKPNPNPNTTPAESRASSNLRCRTEELVRESIAQEQRSKQKHDSGSGNGSRGSAADAKAEADADADGGEDEGRGVQGEEGWDGDGDGNEDRDTKRASSSARSASHVKKRKVRADKGLPRSSSQQTPGEYQKKKLRKAKGTPKPKLSSQPKRVSSAGLSGTLGVSVLACTHQANTSTHQSNCPTTPTPHHPTTPPPQSCAKGDLEVKILGLGGGRELSAALLLSSSPARRVGKQSALEVGFKKVLARPDQGGRQERSTDATRRRSAFRSWRNSKRCKEKSLH